MYLGYQNGKIKFYTEEQIDKAFYNLDKVEETELEYVLDGEEYILKDEAWEEKQAQKEKERIAMLKLTRGDVFRGLLQAKGITRDYIRDMINQLPDETTEEKFIKEMASIDFEEALDFYRGNQLINTIGFQLGITSEQLDKFFETNDYTYLITTDQVTDQVTDEE